jgi:DNA-binding response OmpR family regulator
MPKVLVVDDEPGYREHIKEVFAEDGYEVETAESGGMALKIGRRFLPDLLVVDWVLKSDLDGFDVAKALRQLRPNLTTILITAYPSPELEPKALGSRIGAVLYKPFAPEDLRAAVRRATTGS